MRYFFTTTLLLLIILSVCSVTDIQAQQHVLHAKNGLNATPRNYTYFTQTFKDENPEAFTGNKGYEQHPEIGMLFAETPCDNCYELIGRRTQSGKVFIKEGTGGKDIMQQTATAPMHFKDAKGTWLTVKTHLQPSDKKGEFGALNQETPVVVSPVNKFSSLGKSGQLLQFNHNLQLVYEQPDGTQQIIGDADYNNYTAGDDGVYIRNAWPAIDIEMYVDRGAIKTNFIINSALPAYAAGKLLVRDHLGMNPGWKISQTGDNKAQFVGSIDVKNDAGEVIYTMSPATAYEKRLSVSTLKMLEYSINGNTLDIALPGSFLDRPAASYPVIIDPLVSIAVSSIVGGSAYSPAWTAGCTYFNPATVPPGITVTDVQFSFSYTTSGGAHINNGANDFRLGTCRSPSASGYWWRCTDTGVGTCNEIGVTIFPEIHTCIPPAQCTTYDLNLSMNFYQNYAPTFITCSPSYISALGNLTVTVFGHVVEPGVVTSSPATICQGQSTTLSATSVYGIAPINYSWMPGGLTGSTVTVTPATTTNYTVTLTDACGNSSSSTYLVNVNPIGPITGVSSVCVGGTTTLSNSAGAGTWTSSNTAKATVGSATGVVTGVSKGSATITFISAAGCIATLPITIKAPVAPISGAASICQGSTTTLSDTTSGGTWTSSVPAVASVSGTGGLAVATGLSGGISVITYTTIGGGCFATKNLTVNALSPITGVSSICLGATTTLSNLAAGGIWSSSNTSVATIGSLTGVVTSTGAGVDTITYTLPSGCTTTRSITVNLLSPVTGTMAICQGATTTLSHLISGGTWSSSNPSVAAVNAGTGLVTGISGGTASITYTIAGGCSAYATITVNPTPAITGIASVCVGGTTTLGSGSLSGTWSSSNSAIASASPSTGVVTGIGVGICNISFTSSAGCTNLVVMNVSLATPITGSSSVCPGGSITLSNTTTGGTWVSANTSLATVDITTGTVTGVSAGVVDISYTNPLGCTVTKSVAVNNIAPVTGASVVCAGNSTILTNTIAGGTWSSSNVAAATINAVNGIATGVAAGTTLISYTTPASCVATATLGVDIPMPIVGPSSVCQGELNTLTNAVTGGTWQSTNTAVAVIGGTTGVLNAVLPGTSFISYLTTAGCLSTVTVTVNPVVPNVGTPSLCAGSTTTLTNSLAGGSWSSMNPSIATVGAGTGVVTGVVAGNTTINYTTVAGCIIPTLITVNIAPASITGSTVLCTSTTLSNSVPGGTWSSSNPSVAAISAGTDTVVGVAPGSVIITYTLTNGCKSTLGVTVDPIVPISGIASVCQGSTTTLTYSASSGTWSSLNPGIASIGASTGIVTGVSSGTTTISYVTLAGCIATKFVTVQPVAVIAGSSTVCAGSNITLTNPIGGGSWASSDVAVAPVALTAGTVTGAMAGTATITYSTTLGCISTKAITVNPIDATTGNPSICVGATTTLTNPTVGGGTWSSVLPSIASVSATTGVVTGMAAGTTTIKFTSSLGCVAHFTQTVHPLPSAIIGSLNVCMGSTSTLSNSLPGGIWSSSNILVATVGSASGVLAGISSNTVTITYASVFDCAVSALVTVNPLPLPISGTTAICEGATTNFTDATPGGSWSSLTPAVATVSATGIVSGLLAGTSFIKYTTPAGCFKSLQITVNALPSVIGGTTVLCEGGSSTLTNTLLGGSWSSTNPIVATVGATTGNLAGLTAGTSVITYITTSGCFATATVTVNSTPAISGTDFTNPTTCINTDGTITLHGLHGGSSYSVHYAFGSTPVTVTRVANGLGDIVITGLAAGTYSGFSVLTSLGCESAIVAGPVVLLLPPTPATPVASNSSPVCAGTAVNLTASSTTAGVTYSWSGPGGFTSTLQNPVLPSSVVSMTGAYTVTATKLACVSLPAVTNVVVHPVPVISSFTFVHPTTCQGTDGSVTLKGLDAGVSYNLNYTFNGAPVSTTKVADASGNIAVGGLKAGNYVGFIVSSFTCLSNYAGPVTLRDPNAPPVPVVHSNSPVCGGRTLLLSATDSIADVTYDWQGPNGFSSQLQNPAIPNVALSDSGIYTLIVMYHNCTSVASLKVNVFPSAVLTNVTQDQIVPAGGSIQLHAEGAELYLWAPNNGSLNSADIDTPIASPQVATVYTVIGTNSWGCADSAYVSITIDDNIQEFIPNSFTPNNDGNNDVFRIVNVKYDKLIQFSIYNRWGQQVYHNAYHPSEGWDGRFNGVLQDVGTYYYLILVTRPDGKTKTFKGEVMLLK